MWVANCAIDPSSSPQCLSTFVKSSCERHFWTSIEMAADKVPILTQSALATDGRITTADSDLAPGARAPPHYHTAFAETFILVSGGMTVYTSPDLNEANLIPQELEVGKPVIIPQNTLHSFIIPKEHTKVKVEFAPGNLGFEKTFLIMKGMQDDGSYEEFGSMQSENGAIFNAILGDLTNTLFVGETKEKLESLYAVKGAEIEAKKQELIARYASDEQHKRAAGVL
jgi:quercetin dioxygenase-like cupin family protein